jgi:O-Antigen ligase
MSDHQQDQAFQLRWAPLALMVLMLPWEFLTVLQEYREKTFRFFDTLVTATPSDVAAVVFLALAAPSLGRKLRAERASRGVWLAGWLLAAATVAYLFHPTMRGLSLLVRLAVVAAVVLEVGTMSRRVVRAVVAGPLVTGVAMAGILAAAQIVTGGRIGILGEQRVFTVAGPFIRPSATSTHPYMLAGLALVAVAVGVAFADGLRRRWWLGGVVLCAVPLGLSFSRAAIVSLVVLFALWTVALRRERGTYVAPVAAVLVGFAVPALVFAQGWVARVDDSLTTDIDTISSHRLEITKISLEIIRDHPLVGVGPWNYALASEPTYEDGTLPSPVHDTPLLVTAELGIVAGGGYLVLLWLLGAAALRDGPATLGILVAPLGFWLFDTIPWFYPSGLLLFGVQVALVSSLVRKRAEEPPPIAASAVLAA